MNNLSSFFNNSWIQLNNYICYDPSQILGEGSFGIVYKGYNYTKNLKIAVKHIPK